MAQAGWGQGHWVMGLAVVALLFATPVWAVAGGTNELAVERLDGPVTVDVIRIIDGDTIVVRAHPWLGMFIETHVRLEGIDAPELHAHCEQEKILADQARGRLGDLLASGTARLSNIRHDKYGGRVRALVRDENGLDVGAILIAAGLARAYHGERRGSWCPGGQG